MSKRRPWMAVLGVLAILLTYLNYYWFEYNYLMLLLLLIPGIVCFWAEEKVEQELEEDLEQIPAGPSLKERIVSFFRNDFLRIFEAIGSLYFFVVLAQPLPGFTRKLWESGYLPVQGVVRTLYILAIAIIAGGLIDWGLRFFSKKSVFIKFPRYKEASLYIYGFVLSVVLIFLHLLHTNEYSFIGNGDVIKDTFVNLLMAMSLFLFALSYSNVKGWLSANFLLVVTILVFICYYTNNELSIYLLFIVAAGTIGFNDKKIVKVAFLISTFSFMLTFALSMLGLVDTEISRSADGFKHTFGTVNPNHVSIQLATIVIMYLYLRRRKSFVGMLLDIGIIGAVAYFIRFYAGGRTSVIGLVYVLVGTVFCDLLHLIPAKIRDKYRKAAAAVAFLYTEVSLAVIAMFGVYFSLIYDENSEYRIINAIGRFFDTHSYLARLKSAHQGMTEYVPKMFGQIIIENNSSTDFFWLDVFYVRLLMKYGIIILVCFFLFTTIINFRLARRGRFYQMWIISALPVMGLAEGLVGEIVYNIFPAISLSDMTDIDEEGDEKRSIFDYEVIPVLCVAIWIPVIPGLLSWLRTICYGYGISKKNALLIITGLIVMAAYITWSTTFYLLQSWREKKVSTPRMMGLIRNVLVIIFVIAAGVISINGLRDSYATRISEVEETIKTISDCSEGVVYVDNIPDAYDKKYTGISKPFFYGDELAFFDNIALVTDLQSDYTAFFGRGFVYTPLSEFDALYTNDQAVIKTLEDKGYQFTGFCTFVNTMNLPYEIWRNHLESTADGVAILYGPDHSMARGPFVFTNSTSYEASFDLYLDSYDYAAIYPEYGHIESFDEYVVDGSEDNSDGEDKICTLRIQGLYGEKTLNVKDIYRSDFDENGHLLVTMPFTGAGKGTEFLVLMEEGQSLLLNEITYVRTANYDRRLVTDARGNVTHEEFLDENGNPFMQSGGYYGDDSEYDENDNLIRRVYLDENNNPVNIKDGYAEYRIKYDDKKNPVEFTYYDAEGNPALVSGYYFKYVREYDRDRRIVKELYYDIEDQLVTIGNGSAIVTREYDENNNVSVYKYFGTDSNPVLTTSGYAELHREYDDKRLIIAESYYGIDGKKITLTGGQASLNRVYDENNNVIEECYFGVNDERILLNGNYWKIVRNYNEKKQNIHEEYYDTNDELVLLSGGYCGADRKYNDAGDLYEFIHLGLDLKPVINTSGYSIWRRSFNEKRQIIRQEYLDVNGEPIAIGGGRAAEEYTYDERGNCNCYTYFGLDNERIMQGGSYWKDLREYNEKNQLVHREFYDIEDKPVLVGGSYFSIDYEYDENGTWTFHNYYDFDGNLVNQEKNEN